jgi:hypothetical protein
VLEAVERRLARTMPGGYATDLVGLVQ